MISNNKLIQYVNLAREQNHPDPERAILGRAKQSGLDENFEKDGKIGLFGISKKKAEELGYTNLLNPDDNFDAMLELDSIGYGEANLRGSDDNLLDMYAYSSGITGGKEPKDKYMNFIQNSYDEIAGANGSNLLYDNNLLVDIDIANVEETDLIDESIGNIENQIRHVSSNLRRNAQNAIITGNEAGKEQSIRDIMQLAYESAYVMTDKYMRKK